MAMARKAGLAPDLARDGAQAVRMVAEADEAGKPYRLVLMDMQMPEVDGLEATRRIRLAGYDADALPIVALTANCYADDILACRRAGMQGHLAKPLKFEELEDAVARNVRPVESQQDGEDTVPSEEQRDADNDLASRYRESKRELFSTLARIASGKKSAEWDVLSGQLHRLAGTAGYFGDDELGEKARNLEGQLREIEDPDVRLALLRFEWEEMKHAA